MSLRQKGSFSCQHRTVENRAIYTSTWTCLGPSQASCSWSNSTHLVFSTGDHSLIWQLDSLYLSQFPLHPEALVIPVVSYNLPHPSFYLLPLLPPCNKAPWLPLLDEFCSTLRSQGNYLMSSQTNSELEKYSGWQHGRKTHSDLRSSETFLLSD